jgi:uncharacterized protein YfiM (DUF2279 family)
VILVWGHKFILSVKSEVVKVMSRFCFPLFGFVFLLVCFSFLAQLAYGQECGLSVAFHPSHPDTSGIQDKWLAWDKVEHLGVSALFSGTLYSVFHDFYDNDRKSSLYLSSSLTFSLGLGKEFYDRRIPHNKFSYKDLVADIVGIGLGLWVATR